jgi:dTDP-4-amino-4,6-dideoxygalactose transaminase
MHMQPMYCMHEFITRSGSARAKTNVSIQTKTEDVGADLFARGLCLPSDIKMTPEQQDAIIEIVWSCFD